MNIKFSKEIQDVVNKDNNTVIGSLIEFEVFDIFTTRKVQYVGLYVDMPLVAKG